MCGGVVGVGVCVLCGVVCFLFFFKQKTAYEMRISDWSSDVCSSDLPQLGCLFLGLLLPAMQGVERGIGFDGAKPEQRRRLQAATPEIGRASCRERVCPSV